MPGREAAGLLRMTSALSLCMQCRGVCLCDAHEVARAEACFPVSVAGVHCFMGPPVKEPAMQKLTV